MEVADFSLVTANVRIMPTAWIALVAVDLLNMLRFYHFASERERGASDALFTAFSDRLEAMLDILTEKGLIDREQFMARVDAALKQRAAASAR